MNTGVLNISDGNSPTADTSFTERILRDTTIASGTQSITGVGFKPSRVIIFSSVQGTQKSSWGVVDGALGNSIIWDDHGSTSDTYSGGGSTSITADDGSSAYDGVVTSFDPDGFQITWTKIGSPSGSIQARFLAIK